ncbi:hypothetical protein HN51_036749 [Arachis hypogaea]|uniref:NAD(P)H-quinone oxidoreductase subunit 6, chloroplastic n=1 Tax=Arachis hypogaea TaxID=3818 RepID=A0A444ZYU8_ARAHY|nr:hypothetical protein Ahy_B03g063971 [Arachis hypogaea]
MDLPELLHDFLLVFLGSCLVLGSLGVVFFTNPIFSAFSLGLVLICISLFYILSNSHFVTAAQLLILSNSHSDLLGFDEIQCGEKSLFLGSCLVLGSLGVVFFTNLIFSAFSLGLVLICISLFYILSNSHFVAAAQLLIYVGAINVLILFAVMFMNSSEYHQDFHLLTVGVELL